MARPTKARKVCHFPKTLVFSPEGGEEAEPVVLSVDEYETLRLIDREGLSQAQCAARMQIARGTVQRIYDGAREKLATCLVEGRPLIIQGGDFRLCRGDNGEAACEGCFKRQFHQQVQTKKGEHTMKIAVTYENGQIFQHFGHTEQFKIYEVEDGKVVASQVVDTNGSGHGALAGVLTALEADVLICGGIGGGAQNALAAANIQLYGGVSGDADQAVAAFLAGSLAFNPNVQCSHHDHGESHTCGDHGCGKGHCGVNAQP